MTGASRTGKSTLARSIFLTVAAPRLIVDPLNSSLTQIDGAVTFSDPLRATNAKGENWRQAATARFVPDDPDDRDAYDAVYAWAFAHFPRYVWCDEAGLVMPATGYPKKANRYVIAGGKRMLGHMACHTRPRECNRNLIAQASHAFIFLTPNPDDVTYLANLIGVPATVLAQQLTRINPVGGFLWWNAEQRALTVCPPIKGTR